MHTPLHKNHKIQHRLLVWIQTNQQVLLVISIALIVRLLLWAQPLHQPANDENEYITVAHDILAGRGWVFYEHYHWLRAPLYPLFLAASLWFAQGNLHIAALPNIILSTATVYLSYQITQLLLLPHITQQTTKPVALLAAWFTALLFTFATFASLSMSETLFTFCFTLTLVLLLRWYHQQQQSKQQSKQHGWLLVVAGICYGLATLTRSVSFAFLPIVVAWIWLVIVATQHAPTATWLATMWQVRRRVAGATLLFVVSVAGVIAPWTLRNCAAYGRCIVVETGLSYNIWAFSEPHESIGEIFRTLERIPNPAERADEATRRGMARLREDPAIVLRKIIPNWVALWRVKPIEDRFLLPNYYTDAPSLVFLSALLLDDALYLLIAIAGVVGIAYALTTAVWRIPLALCVLWMAYIVFTTMLTHGESRYRHFLFPVLIPCAAYGLWRVWHTKHNIRTHYRSISSQHNIHWLTIVTTLSIILVLLITYSVSYPWQWAWGGAQRSVYRMVGDVARAGKYYQIAESAYQKAYAAQKTADGRLILGDVYREQGLLRQAAEQYRAGWERKRRYLAASVRLGDVLRALGRTTEARAAFAGYFVPEQGVIDWGWQHLTSPATAIMSSTQTIDVGSGQEIGRVGGVHPAEEQQGATARWTNGHGKVRVWVVPQAQSRATTTLILRLRMAAPHPTATTVPVTVWCDGVCYPSAVPPTWRVVTLLLPISPTNTTTAQPYPLTIEIVSPTFAAPDGREVGVLLDEVTALY